MANVCLGDVRSLLNLCRGEFSGTAYADNGDFEKAGWWDSVVAEVISKGGEK